jgi:hypothetical protein
MTALIVIAAAVVLITAAGFGTIAVVAIGIHRLDRRGHRLTDDARSPIDAVTRRLLGLGARSPAHERNGGGG